VFQLLEVTEGAAGLIKRLAKKRAARIAANPAAATAGNEGDA
jgi:hypothetical protein